MKVLMVILIKSGCMSYICSTNENINFPGLILGKMLRVRQPHVKIYIHGNDMRLSHAMQD